MCGPLQKMCSELGFDSSWVRIFILFPVMESHAELIPGCFAFSQLGNKAAYPEFPSLFFCLVPLQIDLFSRDLDW